MLSGLVPHADGLEGERRQLQRERPALHLDRALARREGLLVGEEQAPAGRALTVAIPGVRSNAACGHAAYKPL